MKVKRNIKKRSHHLWQSTSTKEGDVMIHRNKAERTDLDDFEFVQAKSASLLGLWGASMTDSPLFSRMPHRSASTFSKAAKELQESGEVPPKVMSWDRLAKAFGRKRVEDCKASIQFGMKARLASKELNIPFVAAADLVDEWQKIGTKNLKRVIDTVKAKGLKRQSQTINMFDDPAYQKPEEQEFIENEDYRNPLSEEDSNLLEDFKYEASFNATDGDFVISLVLEEGDGFFDLDKDQAEIVVQYAARVPDNFSEFEVGVDGTFSFLEDKSALNADYPIYNLAMDLQDLYGPKLIWNLSKEDEAEANTYYTEIRTQNPRTSFRVKGLKRQSQTSSKLSKLSNKIAKIMATPIPKIAIDQSAKDYYEAYYGPFGEQLVKEVKKRVKADLAKIWLTKQGVDQATAEYWSSYYTDQNYGELLVDDAAPRKKVKGLRRSKRGSILRNSDTGELVLVNDEMFPEEMATDPALTKLENDEADFEGDSETVNWWVDYSDNYAKEKGDGFVVADDNMPNIVSKRRNKRAQSPIEESNGPGSLDVDYNIIKGMVDVTWGSAWAYYWEDLEDTWGEDAINESIEDLGLSLDIPNLSGVEITEVMSTPPNGAEDAAMKLYNQIQQDNGVILADFIPPGETEDFDRESFGSDLAMESMGTGVRWSDDHEDHGLSIPRGLEHLDLAYEDEDLAQLGNYLYENYEQPEE